MGSRPPATAAAVAAATTATADAPPPQPPTCDEASPNATDAAYADDAAAPPLPPPSWPSHYTQIARVPYGDGEQATLDVLAGYIEREEPVVLEGSDVVDPENWEDDGKVAALLGSRTVLVKRSGSSRFRYWATPTEYRRSPLSPGNDGPQAGEGGPAVFDFEPPTHEEELTFGEFQREAARLVASASSERMYLQETLSGHAEMVDEFRSWNWRFLLQNARRHGWGVPDANELFIGMRGAETDAHFDERHNLFFQVRGTKQLLLFPFVEYERLYPFPVTHPCDRQSMVNVVSPDHATFPAFGGAAGRHATLRPRDLVFIPFGWWHWLRNDDALAVSISFWSMSPPTDLSGGVPDAFSAHELTRVKRNLEKHMASRFGARFPQRMRMLLRLVDRSAANNVECPDATVEQVLAEARALLVAVKVADPAAQDDFLRSMLRVRFEPGWQAHV